MEKKTSTRASSLQQTRSQHTLSGKGKKTKRTEVTQSYSSQISALKANNKQLATALDEVKQDYRKLQQDNLQLKQERQNLLEKVASLEKTARKRSLSETSIHFLQEAQCKLREVQSALDIVIKASKSSPRCKQWSLEHDKSSPKNKVLRFSSPSESKRCTIYPRTPYPLHNMTCVVDGPQLSSTPVKNRLNSIQLSPQKIDYSDSISNKEPPTETGNDKDADSIEVNSNVSPIGELKQEEDPSINPDSTLDQLENALKCDSVSVNNPDRPRRKCTVLSLSYQEPSLNRKLRRGDPFTEQVTDWNPPDQKERKKKISKKKTLMDQRRVLLDVQNQL